MTAASSHLQMQRSGGSSSPDDDLDDGDLGDGTKVKPKSWSRPKTGLKTGLETRLQTSLQRSQSCSKLSPETRSQSQRGHRGRASWSSEADWSHLQLHEMIKSGSLADLSKEELINRLQRATETIEELQNELEVAHRYLEGKYAALKILQGKAILEKATPHTKSLLQKTEDRATDLEKEVNTLQWELSLSQLRLRNSEQAFENNFYRMLCERNSLSEKLKQKEQANEQLQAQHSALNKQYMELLSKVKINPHNGTNGTKESLLQTDSISPQVSDHNHCSEPNDHPP